MLLVLFAGSGCSALIYEIVWYQVLQLAIGSTAVSLGFLLATFMGGLCIGSVWLPRLRQLDGLHPLRLYAYLELGIAGTRAAGAFPAAAGEHGSNRRRRERHAGIAAARLPRRRLPAAAHHLMGASLPAIVRWMKSTPRGVSWWGLLYGGNTAGAVFGCLLAGFYLLRIYNMAVATYVAAAINVVVALASFALAARTPARSLRARDGGRRSRTLA